MTPDATPPEDDDAARRAEAEARRRRLLTGAFAYDPEAERAERERRAAAGRRFASQLSDFREPEALELPKEEPMRMHLRDIERRRGRG